MKRRSVTDVELALAAMRQAQTSFYPQYWPCGVPGGCPALQPRVTHACRVAGKGLGEPGTRHGTPARCLLRKFTASSLGAQASRLHEERAGSPRSQEAIHWYRTCELYFPLNLSGWTTWKVGFKLTSTTFVRLSTLRGAL